MNSRTRPTYSAEFKLETAQLVVDENYSVRDASEAVGVSKSAVDKWVRQLKKERRGISEQPSALTADKIKIKVLEKRIKLDKEILKKATVNSKGQCNNL